ncbi:hypothetical protein [Streptomyces goshikiensis]|uniref:hypothetical protein n=1 Tax=Streptomyces goshikiensis TaxID=1942 RepID=UPI0036A6842E
MTNTDEGALLHRLRVAPLGLLPEDGLVLDIGRGSAAVTVTRDGWGVSTADTSSPGFLRTSATEFMPVPVPGGSLTELRQLLNVGAQDWTTVKTWLLAALLPDINRPALVLSGPQRSGKTVTVTILEDLIDPGSRSRRLPEGRNEWTAARGVARVVGFDDVSHLLDWQLDALCAAATSRVMSRCGVEESLPVGAYDRAFILSGHLTLDELRPDLRERTVAVELPQLAELRPESELWEAWLEARPRILGALLDLLVAVLGALPSVREKAPRVTDYDLVLLALNATSGDRAD